MKLNILLPTDFSDNAWNAIVYALKFYRDEYCTFYLLNSTHHDNLSMAKLPGISSRKKEEEAMKQLINLKYLAETTDANDNHDFQILLSDKDLNTAITKAITDWNIDLVIMGTKGATGAKELVLGSHTIQVLKHLKYCAILIVPDEFEFVKPEYIAFPTDYSRTYTNKEIRALKHLADVFISKIKIVHINDSKELSEVQKYNLMKLKSDLNNYEYTVHSMPKRTKKSIEIINFVEDFGINLLALVHYKHSFLEKMVKENIIENLGLKPSIPMLVIPE
ncbi:universal stress protein [Formosa sp. S-31]|uniref:universal stress protein n=1 Tax=Formosa sp. S-31 TaxID=2790949 RepID=UPI003EB9D979